MVLSAYMLYVTRTWPGLYIPYLDMFNHSVQFGSVIQSDKHYQQIQTMVDYLPGEQVYVSYGIKDVLMFI